MCAERVPLDRWRQYNLYALSELFQVPIDAIVRGNRVPIAPDIIVKPLDSRESRLCAYYEKLQEKRAA